MLDTPKKILLLPICGLGDAVCYLPYLQALCDHFPTTEIAVVVATAAAGAILRDNTSNVEVIVFNRSQEKNPIVTLLRMISSIRRRKFDVVISGAHPDSVRVPIFAFLSGARVRIGAKSERFGFFYNRPVDVSPSAHYVDRYRALLTGVGIERPAQEFAAKLDPPAESKAAAKRLWDESGLANAEIVIGMVSGADANVRGQWQPSLKRWTNAGYAEVAKWATRELGARVVMIGSGAEAGLADEIAKLAGVPVVNLCGKTGMQELQWIIRMCTAIVSNDTGTMHLAGALGTQVVALFGPTNPASFKPPGEQNRILTGHAPCSPCYPYPCCNLKVCKAMENIPASDVINGLNVLIGSGQNAAVSKD